MNERKKILVFTGAGVSKESGIETFRDSTESLWNNHRIEDVATPGAWRKDRELVLDFYNQRRAQLKDVVPNLAHELIAKLEENFDVTVVTQNVDDLHERAGSTNVIHLHGELTKARGCMYTHKTSPLDTIIDIGYGEIKIGDKCQKTGSQLRPHIVWFGEELDSSDVNTAVKAAEECDFCIIVGTSLQVSPANEIPFLTDFKTPVYYIEPSKIDMLMYDIPDYKLPYFHHIEDVATNGMQTIFNQLNK